MNPPYNNKCTWNNTDASTCTYPQEITVSVNSWNQMLAHQYNIWRPKSDPLPSLLYSISTTYSVYRTICQCFQ